jgi:FkbM family methyltransferase
MTESRRDPRYEFEGLCLRRPMVDAIANARWVEKMGTGGTLLDLGANIAEVALRCSNQFDRIVCVEANPTTCEIARRRIAAAGANNIAVVNRVVAPDGAPDEYWVSNPSVAAIGARARREKWSKKFDDGYYVRVKTASFSSLLSEHAPRCVKIDIEGGEFEVFDPGQVVAYDRLGTVEFVVVEFHNRRKRAIPAIVERLRDRGLDLVNRDEIDRPTRWSLMTLLFVRRGLALAATTSAAHRGR